jgi:hypothetical protein
MCDCRNRIESKLREDLPAQLPEGHKDLGVRLEGYALMMGEGVMRSRQIMPIEITYQAPTKAGVMKARKQTMSMAASYCMFCGERYS